MNATQTGLLAGLILGVAVAVGGFTAFLITIAVGVIGFGVGRFVDGGMELGDLFGRGRDR
ncbi:MULTISPECIES: DUF2273 domain-containing protein [Actinopolyspora]|uniref:Small integral membrane protein n=1 Tax=Actinopolyspora saharensis TaxID=995062 RepID=A0A1H0Y022_9ACTN|nr:MULTISPECIES: hypothetical protein [Actinopolyspora]NHD17448.1 hypothetical protein [Actinopolyspora sp. BKK2]NHE76819.1 hypothetical protein [Actinopolyspora sp. BKK1]SDQ08517.1 hypothetical protein SAMN04489718_0138 [Actinopolyspora saharensis]